MKSLAALFAFFVFAVCANAQAPQLLYENAWNSTYTTAESVLWTAPPKSVEAADDFDLQGIITRVVVTGNGCFNCAPPSVAGVYLKFYQAANSVPGALQYEVFIPGDSPNLLYNPLNPETFDITLTTPFVATGKHYISAQVSFNGGGYWAFWISNFNHPTGTAVRVRDNLGTGKWGSLKIITGQIIKSDLAFQLWGFNGIPNPPSADPCGTWTPMPTPNPPLSINTQLNGVKVFASFDAWAAGNSLVNVAGADYDNLVTVMHFDGQSWTEMPVPTPSAAPGMAYCLIHDIDGTASNDLWIAGQQDTVVPGGWFGPQLLAMHFDGQNWTVMNTPIPPTSIGAGVSGASVADIETISKNDVWFAGSWIELDPATSLTKLTGLLMHWNGSTFEMPSIPFVNPLGQTFTSITANNSGDVWAVGATGNGGLSSTSMIFHYDGVNWSHVPGPAPGDKHRFIQIKALSTNDVWAWGESQDAAGFHTFMMHWDGSLWTLFPGPPAGVVTLHFVNINDIHGAGLGVWHFDGFQWTQVQTFPTVDSGSIHQLGSVSPCEFIGVGAQWKVGSPVSFAARIDNGLTATASVRHGCSPSDTPAQLIHNNLPRVGGLFSFMMDDPANAGNFGPSTQLYGFCVVASAPDIHYPCGTILPLVESSTGQVELLVSFDATQQLAALGPATWPGPGNPAQFLVVIPNDPMLAGMNAYMQGVLADFSGFMKVVFTNALDIRIGY